MRVHHLQVIILCAAIGLWAWDAAAGILISLIFLVPIIIAIELGKTRDRSGWMWGLFLGWLGVLILAIMRPVQRSVNV